MAYIHFDFLNLLFVSKKLEDITKNERRDRATEKNKIIIIFVCVDVDVDVGIGNVFYLTNLNEHRLGLGLLEPSPAHLYTH